MHHPMEPSLQPHKIMVVMDILADLQFCPPPHCDHLRGEGDTTTAMESHGHERLIEKGVVGAADGNEVS